MEGIYRVVRREKGSSDGFTWPGNKLFITEESAIEARDRMERATFYWESFGYKGFEYAVEYAVDIEWDFTSEQFQRSYG